MEYKIEIPFFSPGGNALRKMPAWKYAKLREEILRLLRAYFRDNGHPIGRGKRVHVSFMRTYSRVEQDYENLAFTGKPWFDALKMLSCIEDDSPKWVVREYSQEQSREHKVVIVLKRAQG